MIRCYETDPAQLERWILIYLRDNSSDAAVCSYPNARLIKDEAPRAEGIVVNYHQEERCGDIQSGDTQYAFTLSQVQSKDLCKRILARDAADAILGVSFIPAPNYQGKTVAARITPNPVYEQWYQERLREQAAAEERRRREAEALDISEEYRYYADIYNLVTR